MVSRSWRDITSAMSEVSGIPEPAEVPGAGPLCHEREVQASIEAAARLSSVRTRLPKTPVFPRPKPAFVT